MARLPLIGQLVVEEPCSEDWDAMAGERTRFCGSCKKTVTDLSSVEAAEAEAFLSRHRGKSLCVRIAVVALATGCSTHAPSAVPASKERPAPVLVMTTEPTDEPEPMAEPEAAPSPAPEPIASPSPTSKQKSSRVMMGCVCIPAEPLCSCL